jgi:acyl-CoA thioester hydrolase
MGFVYYGNYAIYYEIARTELIRKLGLSYKEIEAEGVFLPVNLMEVKYIKPAKYDDVLTIKTTIDTKPSSRLSFKHEIYNSENELLNIGKVSLTFISANTGKPCKPSKKFEDIININFLTN